MKTFATIVMALLLIGAAAAADMSGRGVRAASLHATFGLHLDGANSGPTYAWWAASIGKGFSGPDPMQWAVAMTDDRTPYLMQGNMQGYVVPGAPASWGNGWAGQPNKPSLVLSVPLAFGDLSLSQVAAGAADSAYLKGFAYMAQAGFPQIVLRLGWEQGGSTPGTNWMPWDMPYDPATYAAAFRHVHDLAVRALPGARFEWNTADPIGGLASYPGDAYVNVVGWDVYRRPSDPPGFGGSKLADYRAVTAFAAAHGKLVGFSEFGLNTDDPSYVSGFCNQISHLPAAGAGSLAYWSLFQGTPNDGYTYDIHQFPNALAALKSCL